MGTYGIATNIRDGNQRDVGPSTIVAKRETPGLNRFAVDRQGRLGLERDLGCKLLQLDVVVIAKRGELLLEVLDAV